MRMRCSSATTGTHPCRLSPSTICRRRNKGVTRADAQHRPGGKDAGSLGRGGSHRSKAMPLKLVVVWIFIVPFECREPESTGLLLERFNGRNAAITHLKRFPASTSYRMPTRGDSITKEPTEVVEDQNPPGTLPNSYDTPNSGYKSNCIALFKNGRGFISSRRRRQGRGAISEHPLKRAARPLLCAVG